MLPDSLLQVSLLKMKTLHQYNNLGYSVYLSSFDEVRESLDSADQNGTAIFTSLHISEEFDDQYCENAKRICRWLADRGYQVMADVSKKTVEQFGATDMVQFAADMGITSLRIDYGFSDAEMIELSQQIPIVVNASTIDEELASRIVSLGGKISAMHNFYPRPETGLSSEFFAESTAMLQRLQIPVYVFIAGDLKKRGPIYAGLPTLEKHREWPPLVAYADYLYNFKVDQIFVGDVMISPKEKEYIKSLEEGILPVPVKLKPKYSYLYNKIFHSRPDSPGGAARLAESREYSCAGGKIEAENTIERKRGSITLDNILYGRYSGEIQILRTDYPADEKVNVIGSVKANYLPLVDCIPNGSRIMLVKDVE